MQSRTTYLNYDAVEHRLALNDRDWDRDVDLVIFDELHKKKNWKAWLKGIYDVEGIPPQILVTGSARLNTYRKVGDSMAGRFFHHRLHPLDLKELAPAKVDEALEQLLTLGGFPEPFLRGTDRFHRRWRRTHLDVILRQDLLDNESIADIRALETMLELLRRRVGSTVSYANLARDVEKDPKTIKRWLQILENHYVLLRVPPYHDNIARALLKEPKYFFFDTGQVSGDEGCRLENVVALALHKELHRLEDQEGIEGALNFVRTKDGREIDFVVSLDGQPRWLIEVKASDDQLSPAFGHFARSFKKTRALQLVRNLRREKTFPAGPAVRRLGPWLKDLDLGAGSG